MERGCRKSKKKDAALLFTATKNVILHCEDKPSKDRTG